MGTGGDERLRKLAETREACIIRNVLLAYYRIL